jgi:hypothetical protein
VYRVVQKVQKGFRDVDLILLLNIPNGFSSFILFFKLYGRILCSVMFILQLYSCSFYMTELTLIICELSSIYVDFDIKQ